MEGEMRLVGSSMAALTEEFRAVAHNLANANTSGYKRLRGSFEEVLAVAGASVQNDTGVDFGQGVLRRTGRPLDVALDGKGFFVLETPAGPLYTRNGCFTVNATGQLVDSAGRMVGGSGGPIVIPPDVSAAEVHVGTDGSVTARDGALGKLRAVRFEDPDVLQPAGDGCYRAPDDVAATEAAATVHQGCLESSNVSTVQELVRLIAITRLYQANAKTIESMDERTSQLLSVAMGS